MKAAWVLATRELGSMFRTPAGWIVIALFTLLTGLVFVTNTLVPGAPATLRYFFSTSAFLLVPIAPAVSMRLFSEEYRSGSYELLGTSPLGVWTITCGKLMGAMLFLMSALLPTLAFPVILFTHSDPPPDVGPMITGYLGLLLIGSVYVAIGAFASSLTASQTLAFLSTVMFLVLFSLASSMLATRVNGPFADVLRAVSIDQRMRDFSIGVLDTTHLVYFAGLIGLFATLTAASTAMRRWR
ncbi:MAG: ABC transporter permease [Phycisphaerales bacterium]